MSRDKQGTKAGREERHRAAERARKERKALRRQRADVHRAMAQAEATRKAKKKGRDQFDRFMAELGYAPKADVYAIKHGREVAGDVLDKYEVIS